MPDVAGNGIKIHYEERGNGEPLLLIMGLGADGSRWEDHVRRFERHFRCILMDNRGVGLTDKPHGAYATATMAEDSAALLRALGLQPARVAGISMGGAIAQCLAIQHPEMVDRLVLISSWGRCDAYAKTVFEHFVKARAVLSRSDFMQLLQLWIFTPAHYSSHLDDMLQGQADAAADPNPQPQHGFEAQCAACIGHDSLGRLGEIAAPTLITAGEADIFTPMGFAVKLHERIRGSRLEIFKGLGHAHHWEALDEFNETVTSFLLGS
jgi:pimeloyl-ACP methyl ester carboxylesterase